MLLVLVVLSALVMNKGVDAHMKFLQAHFDNPQVCAPGDPIKNENGVEVPHDFQANDRPCITRKTFSSSDKTCSGDVYQTVNLIADDDCWHVATQGPGNHDPESREYYKIKCDTDGSIAGRMLCNKGCSDCIETNYADGFSLSYFDLIKGIFQYEPGACCMLRTVSSCIPPCIVRARLCLPALLCTSSK